MSLPTQQTSSNPQAIARQKTIQALEKYKGEIALALPKHLNADRMARLAMTCFSQNPKLFECETKSVFGSIIQASQLGLEIGVNGQGYLIPYGKTCQFVPGWKGLMDLLARTGRGSVHTAAVYDGDYFEYELGTNPNVIHRPGDNHGLGKITHVYAVGRVNGSQYPIIEVWSMSRVFSHRDKYNKVGQRHYSFQHEEMYARKVVLLQVLKYMPSSPELTAAIDYTDRAEIGQVSGIDAFNVGIYDGDFSSASVDTETGEISA